MSKTNTGLVAYAKAMVGKPYWYGTYGQTASKSLYTSKKKQYPDYYTATDFESQYGEKVHDCVGLIKGYLWSENTTSTPKYTSSQDKSAKGMYTASEEKGKIATFPKHAGQLVYKGSSTSAIHHVGVYDGNGYVYEAKGHAYGVVKTKFVESDWPYWSQCPYCEDDSQKAETTTASSATSTVKATEYAKSGPSSSVKGTYKVTASNLRIRNGAGTTKNSYGTDKSVLVLIPKGTSVTCYGYYTTVSGIKWLYVAFTYKNVYYEGFACSTYLKKQ